MKFQIGDRVKYKGRRKYYPATIIAIQHHYRFNILAYTIKLDDDPNLEYTYIEEKWLSKY